MLVAKQENRILQLFKTKKERILSIYFTAGFPTLNDTLEIAVSLENAGADMIEVGIPYSDPIADGPTIQDSNTVALNNGMSIKVLMEQLTALRARVEIPVILMGYVNPVMQYGVERFCKDCHDRGIDGIILPDLPMQAYLDEYKLVFDQYGLSNVFLITPQTSEERIRLIDKNSNGFIYMVSSASTTGAKSGIEKDQEAYFDRIQAMDLINPTLIGFGISNQDTFDRACLSASGAIIGSAFINVLKASGSLKEDITQFVKSIKTE